MRGTPHPGGRGGIPSERLKAGRRLRLRQTALSLSTDLHCIFVIFGWGVMFLYFGWGVIVLYFGWGVIVLLFLFGWL